MDFPLVSIALAYDGINALELPRMKPMIATLPLFETFYRTFVQLDKHDPQSWQPTGERQVLMRNATTTRSDYGGQGLMRKLSQWLMREAALKGYRGIQIECAHDAVRKVWMNPSSPFRADMVAEFDTPTWEVEGKKPFEPAKQVVTRVYVVLKEGKEEGDTKEVAEQVAVLG